MIENNKIKENSLDLTESFSEFTLDNFLLKNDLLKDFPVVGTLHKFVNLTISIKDGLFLKKLYYFLNKINDISLEEKVELINDIDSSKKYRIKTGEKILYIIDSCDDYEKSENIGIVFRSFLEKKIDYEIFVKISKVVSALSEDDLNWIINLNTRYVDIGRVPNNLLSLGIFHIDYNGVEVDIEKEEDADTLMEGGNEYKSEVNGGDLDIKLNDIGLKIKDIFLKKE